MFRRKAVCTKVLVAFLAMSAGAVRGQGPMPPQGLLREVWEGIGGASLADLTGSPDFPARPTSSNYVTDLFEAPTDVLENYGQRLRGYLVPPLTGDYTFWIASDDAGGLYLSTDEDPARATQIARVDGWTSSREWTRESNQQSAPIRLIAGKAYYVAALMKEGGGGDNLAVRWRLPDGTDQAPIVATNLLPWGIAFTAPSIARQPADTSAVEGGVARFEVGLGTAGPASFQWRRNGVALPGATSPELVFGPVRFVDQGARFSVVVTNRLGAVTSREAVLTVTADVTPPTLVDALNLGTTWLRVRFSEPVAPASATNAGNYGLDAGLTVRAARLGPDSATVELVTDPMTFGSSYTLTVSGVRDQAQASNPIAAGSLLRFTAVEYAPAGVGLPPVAGTVVPAAGGATVTGSGDVGGTNDLFQFAYQLVTGDFDRRARVASFTPTDPFAKAGLMARATLDGGSPFAAVLTTPAQVGSFFLTRPATGVEAIRSGSAPANFPETWLRLARTGGRFTGFASLDGRQWVELGRQDLALPATVFLGFAAGSRDDREAATVAFRDAGTTTGATTVASLPRRAETLGPSSRLTPLVISEVHYHPRERTDGRNTEFIELYNADLITQDLSGYRLTGSVGYAFPDGYRLPAGGFAVVARVPADVAALYGLTGVLGPFEGTNNLPNAGGLVQLRNPLGAVVLEVGYGTRDPWPVAADGAGPSLVLARPSFGEGDPRAWRASDQAGGSPGGPEVLRTNPYATLVINEVLAHTDLPQLDFVEVYNRGNEPVDLGECILTDQADTHRFRIPAGTVITPRGFLAWTEEQLGFRLDAAGEAVFLLDPSASRVIDAVRFGPQENGVSSGRHPDGTPEWRRLEAVTAGGENRPFRVSDVVINEIMYAPISGHDDDEFVELHNRADRAIDVSDWSLQDGVSYRLPSGTVMPAGGFLVVVRDRTRFLTNYPAIDPAKVLGNYRGSLANGGERLALARPDWITTTNELGLVQTNRIDIELAEVTYGNGGRWGRWSDGLGSSLELVDPHSDPRQPSNWADSDESNKAGWTTLEFTGLVDHAADGVGRDRLHLLAQGPGEYLIDDVEVLAADGSSRLANGSFTDGLTGWTAQGNHRASGLAEGAGIEGGRALRLVATGRGDTAVNRVRANLTASLPLNANATLRARVKWVRGWPEFLVRLRGNGLEAYGRLAIPTQLGTPGAPNSRAVPNAGPAIVDVRHSPVVPRDRETVVVTARVIDPDGIRDVTLRSRADPSSTLSSVAMRDDGTGGDAVAGDGVFSATLSGRSAGTLVAFRIEAADAAAASATSRFPADAPQREALIRWGEERPFGNLGVYRFWQRKSDFDRLRSREPLANDNLDCTFVYGDERVIYNAEMRAKGSPWHGGSVGADYVFAMPDDDRLLGARDLAVVTIGNLGSDPSAQREQAAFWIGSRMGAPALHRRHIRFFENGVLKGSLGLYEDTEEPNGLYVDRWFPEGEDGELFKIEDWFEFGDSGDNFLFSRDATLQRFTTGGGDLKLARYRWSWRRRAVVDSANNYANFLNLVRAVNGSGSAFVTQVDSLVDIDNWMRVIALQHLVGNWDAYGYSRGKNAYLYLPTGGRWKLVPWDIDFVLGSGSDLPTGEIFTANDPTIGKLWDTPAFRRMYWQAFQDAVNGPLRDGAIGPVLDGRFAALQANGVNPEGTTAIKGYVSQRRQYLEGRLRAEDAAALAITSNGGNNFATNRNLVSLAGTAPFAARGIEVNGIRFPVNWTSATQWSLAIPLAAATNVLQVTGVDRAGQPIPGFSDSITVRYTGALPRAEDLIVLNEIQYDPTPGGSEFVEIHNTSATGAFDLSGWRLDGAGFVFPEGTLLRPGGFLVVVSDLAAFRNAFGATVVPVGTFTGNLQNDGERLRLVQPGTTPEADRVIDEVRYDNQPPWPTEARGAGPSLQLIDPLQDNRRPANWAATPPGDPNQATPGRVNALAATLPPFPTLWLNEVVPVNRAGPVDRQGDRDPWVELYNAGTNVVDLAGLYLSSTYSDLTQWAFPAGASIAPGQFLVVWCDGEPGESTASEWHSNFRLTPGQGRIALSRLQGGRAGVLDSLDYEALPDGLGWGSFPDGQPIGRWLFHLPSPGAANRLAAPPTLVFINEWMASNGGLFLDPADGDPDDWFELHNAGVNPADLSAFTLTDDLANPTKFTIPNGTVIPPGGFLLVWADEEPQQSTNGQVHADFRLSGSGEALGLYAPDGTAIDALSFGVQSNNVSQGRLPDGGSEPFVSFDMPTPAAPNRAVGANLPPVLARLDNLAVDEGGRLAFRATATDPDAGQQLRFSVLGAPPGATLDPITGEFGWTTGEADGPGEYAITVRVTDDGAPPRSASQGVTLSVRELNQPPVLGPIADQAVAEGNALEILVTGSDPDLPPQPRSFSLAPGAPGGAAIDPVTGVFRWIPGEEHGGATHAITVRLSDGWNPPLEASRTFQVTVTEVDDPPAFEPVSLQTTDEGVPFTLRLVARDPDNPPKAVRFELVNAPSGAAVHPEAGEFTWTPPESAGPGTYPITVRAAEIGNGPASTLTFSLVVNERNTAPEIGPLADFDVTEGTTVVFTATATDADLPVQQLSFSLEPDAPAEASIDPATGAFRWPIGSDVGARTHVIGVRVTDSALEPRSSTRTFTVVVRPQLRLVINEIMYAPRQARTEYVELFNPSAATGWSLEGWRLTGLEFGFPSGTVLAPGAHLVVARDRAAFRAAYGTNAAVVGDATPAFGASGRQWIRLQRPTGGAWETVDEVAFERSAPWPTAADGGGAALQLLDPVQDNRRVANWAALTGTTTNAPIPVVTLTNVWRYFQDAAAPDGWRDPGFNDQTWRSGRGLLYVEDAALPAPKNTALVRTDGRMTYYFRTGFAFAGHPSGASLRLSTVVDDGFVMYLNGKEIFRLGVESGVAVSDTTPANRTVSDAILEGPFTVPVTNLVSGTNVIAVEVHQVNATSSDIVWGAAVEVLEVRREAATPGYANSTRTTLAPFPEVWINEVLPRNLTGAVDNAGDRDPWVELLNRGTHSIDLAGWWLTDDLTRLNRWAFPSPAILPPRGYQLVWTDSEPAESTPSAWHASFVPGYPRGVIALVRDQGGIPVVVDYLAYDAGATDLSFGVLDEADPLNRGPLPAATPGAPNQRNRPPELAAIADREIQAGNQLTFRASAVDPDTAQTLRFDLASGAPGAAAMDPVTGQFTWTPLPSQVGTHTLTIRVTDDGQPPLGDQRSFQILVRPAELAVVQFTGIQKTPDGQLRLTWSTEPGRRYRVIESETLIGPWSETVPAGPAGGTTQSADLPLPTGDRFYRVERVP